MEYMILVSVVIGFIMGRWEFKTNEAVENVKENTKKKISERKVRLKAVGGGTVEEDKEFNIYD